jgi:predicted  nucleic acid-binding Zn-ribbon protein
MSEKEALIAKKTEAEAKVNNEEAQKLSAELADLNAKLTTIEAEIAECRGRRNESAKKVSPRFLTTYDRLRKTKKNGVAVGLVTDANRFCSACGNLLTAQRFIEVKRNNTVMTCEACGSFLIWKKEG